MFSYKLGLLPKNFDSFSTLNEDLHSYSTRNANFFHLLLCQTFGSFLCDIKVQSFSTH